MNLDFSFCRGNNCENKQYCNRWVGLHPELADHPRLLVLLQVTGHDCKLFEPLPMSIRRVIATQEIEGIEPDVESTIGMLKIYNDEVTADELIKELKNEKISTNT